jgi:uncharacterized protein (DUF305 family)
MKRLFVFQLGWIFLVACNNDASTSTASGETTTTEQSNTAAAGDTSTSTSPGSSTMPFMGVMDKMMKDMHAMKMTEDPDHDFAMMMKSHHQGAIDMANIELAQGANAELKQLAQKIIDDSEKDNRDLDAFLSTHQPDSKSDFHQRAMDMMMKPSNMEGAHSGSVDQQFATMMIHHHQQGIDMASAYLKSAKEDQAKKVANNVIKANSEDITKLRKFSTGNASAAPSSDTGKANEHAGH